MKDNDIVCIDQITFHGQDHRNCMIVVEWTDAAGDQGSTWGYSNNPEIQRLLDRWEQQRSEP